MSGSLGGEVSRPNVPLGRRVGHYGGHDGADAPPLAIACGSSAILLAAMAGLALALPRD
jgi:hypothetical protein